MSDELDEHEPRYLGPCGYVSHGPAACAATAWRR
jgi:hypothetical protein